MGEVHRRVHVKAGDDVRIALRHLQRVAQVLGRRPVRALDDDQPLGIDGADRPPRRCAKMGFQMSAVSLSCRLVQDLVDDRPRHPLVAGGDLPPQPDQPGGVGLRRLHHRGVVVQVDDDRQVVRQRLVDGPVHPVQESLFDAVGRGRLGVRTDPHRHPHVIEAGVAHGPEVARRDGPAPVPFVRGVHGVAEVHAALELGGGMSLTGSSLVSLDALRSARTSGRPRNRQRQQDAQRAPPGQRSQPHVAQLNRVAVTGDRDRV